MKNFIPVNEPIIGDYEKHLVNECLDSGWISSEGPFVSQFEEAFSNAVGRTHGIACSNGSTALDLAIAALEIKPGDEIILPTFTIISCAAAIVRSGAIPVCVDIDRLTWNMNTDQVRSAVTSRTAAIMIVHIYGLPADIDPIIEIAKNNNLKIIEDSAELIGGIYKDSPCGSFGDISTFSFYPNKQVTTGEGGMVCTDDNYLADRCRSLRNLCFQKGKRFVHNELGWNYRMSNIQAALGLGQLSRLKEIIDKKLLIGNYYHDVFSTKESLQPPCHHTDYANNIFWVYGLISLVEEKNASFYMKHLANEGIGTRPFFYPIHKQPVFANSGYFDNIEAPVSEYIAEQGFYIPSGLALTDTQQDIVIRSVLKYA